MESIIAIVEGVKTEDAVVQDVQARTTWHGTPVRRRVEIDLLSHERAVMVWDNGPGMSKHTIENVRCRKSTNPPLDSSIERNDCVRGWVHGCRWCTCFFLCTLYQCDTLPVSCAFMCSCALSSAVRVDTRRHLPSTTLFDTITVTL